MHTYTERWTFPFAAYTLLAYVSAYACSICTYANSPVDLSTEEQIDMQFHWRKIASIKFQLQLAHAACTCVYIQVRTHQRLFRQMIVSSDAINQRRKIKSQTFECESQFESFGFVWLTYWSAAATGVKSIRKITCKSGAYFSFCCCITSPNSRRTISRSFQSLDGSHKRLVVCCFLSNYGNTNWIFISEFHVLHWTCCWFMF